jgi:dephospho-CoA kinase
MLKVGLTGGLASGKSFVGAALAGLGAHLIQADLVARETILPSGEAYQAVIDHFGRSILDPDGAINRKRLAAEVFDNPDRLALLNSLVHPSVFRREDELIATYTAEDPHGIVVVEAAIMIEVGSYRRYDQLILAVCGEEQQIERAMARDGMTRNEALVRLRSQMPLSEKRKFARHVIDTSGSKDDTLEQVRQVWLALREKIV